jgi:methionyl-tRNA formyltransferase
MERLDVLVMTGSKPRHQYFAAELLRHFDRSAMLVERHPEVTAETYVKQASALMEQHFAAFDRTQSEWFAEPVAAAAPLLQARTVREIEFGTPNATENVAAIRALDPRLIAVHSTSLIKEELIGAFPQRIINLHAGLSPYYRGSGTNLYPFYYGDLECVGMTVHYLDIGIDSGDIILQGRPVFDPDDNPHTIGCKNVQVGAALMTRGLERYLSSGPPPGVKQDLSRGKLFLKKAFNDEVLQTIQRNLANGMVRQYAAAPRSVAMVEW